MKAKKIYNNNVVLSVNEKGAEVILVGRGLGFKLHNGMKINEHRIEKRFELRDGVRHKFQQLIQDVPVEQILLCERVIDFIKKKSPKVLNDSIYVTLTDHILTMISRLEQGVDFDTTILLNIKNLYRDEYKIALQAIDLLRDGLQLKIDDSEAYFVTLHIVNAETNSNMMTLYTITTIIDHISQIVNTYFTVDKEDNTAYDRFLTHCRFFVQRVVNKEHLSVDDQVDDEMLSLIVKKYPRQYECLQAIVDYINEKYHYKVARDEQLYLMIHLNKLAR